MKNCLCAAILILSLFMTSLSFAKGGYVNVYDVLKRMKTELQLTDAQVEAIEPIIKESLRKRDAFLDSLQEDAVINKDKVRVELHQLKEEENQKLSAVLSKDQMKKLVDKQHIRESLNKDQIDYSEGLSSGLSLTPQGGSMQF